MKQGWFKFITCSCFLAMCAVSHLSASDKYEEPFVQGDTFQNDGVSPRTLHDYIGHEKEYWDYLKKNHPIFQYEKEGRLVGKYNLSDRVEEFEEINKGPEYAKINNMDYTAVTYRLGMESFLDFPNKFVGPKKCGECHPAQYMQWERSRHAKTIRFPEDLEEVGGDPKRGLPGAIETTPILTTGFNLTFRTIKRTYPKSFKHLSFKERIVRGNNILLKGSNSGF